MALVACGALAALASGCSDSEGGCKEGQTDCDGKCVDLASDEDHCGKCGTSCDEGKGFICSSSSCTCLGGGTDCDGTCVNTTADAKNCGECGKACAAGEVCNGGNCETGGACEAPKKVCGDSCIDIQSDNQNCGDCGVKCDETKGYTCVAGGCVCAKDLIECGDTCVNPNTATDHCGTCGNACAADEVCQAGACVGGCTEPLTDCDGSCVDTSSDNNNCGVCGTKCETANGFICQSGVCGCAIGTDCSGQCVDTQTNGNHCGDCGNVCDPGQACKNGVCSIDCAPLTQCGNQCVDTQTNVDNCGDCATPCTGGMVCSAGACDCPAAAPEDCSGQCADLQTDEQHCGSCGNACTGGQSCVAGKCQAAQLLSVVIECPETTVAEGTVMSCTATGTLQDGNTVPMTADPNLTWTLENDSCNVPAVSQPSATISNTPPTKGELTTREGAKGCTIDVKATYVAGTQTLISSNITITIIERTLLSIAIAPDNPTVPYLEDSARLRINFKVLGTYDSGQVLEVQRVGGGGPQPSWAWVSGNKTTADFVNGTEAQSIGLAELTDKNVPTGSATSQITVTYFEDTSDSTTERTANTLLTVVPGNATGASIQPSTATIPLGTIAFSFVVSFNNQLDFDVTDLCDAKASWPNGSPSPVPFTKHYENYCYAMSGAIYSFYLHEVSPSSSGPMTTPSWKTFDGAQDKLVFPKDAAPYTPRQMQLVAKETTAATPAVVEGNFNDGAYSANRVFARAQVNVGDAALIACRLRINESKTWVEDETKDTGFLGRTASPTNNRFPVNLQGYEVEVLGLYSDSDSEGVLLTDKVTYSTTNSAIADPSNGAGTEGETSFGQVGTATITATEPGSGVTCSATVEVVQGKLCGVRLVPLFKNKVGRRAYQVDTNDEPTPGRISGPGQTTHNWLNRVFLPNEANWSQGYRLDAWYATPDHFNGDCPKATYDGDVSGCMVELNSETGDFWDFKNACFKVDVTGQGSYEIIPDPSLTVADPALSLNGAVATTKVSTDNPFRQDQIKATFIDGLTATAKETVTVCGKRVADPDLHVDVWDTFTDTTQSAVKQTVPVAGKTQYRASLWFEMGKDASDNQLYCGKVDSGWPGAATTYDIFGYRMEITEDASNWGSGANGTATVANDAGNRGEITGVAVGTTTITATFAGHSNVLNVEVGELDVQSCEVLVPATMLYHGGGVGETMRPTVSAKLSDGSTVDITNGFKASFCPIDVDGDKYCEIDWSLVTDTGSDTYFNINDNDGTINAGEGLVWLSGAGNDNTRKIAASCDGCQISGTTTKGVDCTVSPVIEAKPATVTKLFIQTQDKTCFDAETNSLKMTQDTSDNLKACVIYNHGAFAELDGTSDSADVTWSGGTSMTMENDGKVTVFANGTTDTITATHVDGPTDTITIEATADKFDSLEIRGTNIGAAGCAAQPSQPTDGLQGCEIEDTTVYFWLIGKRADASEQNLTYMVGTWDDDDKAHADPANTGSATKAMYQFYTQLGSVVSAEITDADNNGGYTDTVISVDTTSGMGINPAVCTAACPASVTANVRVYDADPTQASMTVTATPAASATAASVIKLSVTAQPNQGSAPTIDITQSIDFDPVGSSANRAAFYVYDGGGMTNGYCLAMPVAVATTSDITAEFDAAGGTSTVISKDITLTATP